jgi:hypothetical protein
MISGRQVVCGNDAIRREIAALDKTKPQVFEEFLTKYKNTLHPTKWHMPEIKYALSQMYGNMQILLLLGNLNLRNSTKFRN